MRWMGWRERGREEEGQVTDITGKQDLLGNNLTKDLSVEFIVGWCQCISFLDNHDIRL